MTEKKVEKNVRISRVHCDLIFCGIADETLVVREGDIRGGGAVTLVVGDDLYTIVLPDTDTAVEKKVRKELRREGMYTYE
jgi:hypothetical protein